MVSMPSRPRPEKPLAEVTGLAGYGGILEWACARPGCCEVRYERGGLALQDAGSVAARIALAGTALGGERTSPRWNVYFPYRTSAGQRRRPLRPPLVPFDPADRRPDRAAWLRRAGIPWRLMTPAGPS